MYSSAFITKQKLSLQIMHVISVPLYVPHHSKCSLLHNGVTVSLENKLCQFVDTSFTSMLSIC